MATSEYSIKLAGRLGTYLIAHDLMTDDDIQNLQTDLVEAKGDAEFLLPR
jgi:DNA sulfur modification protein DndB